MASKAPKPPRRKLTYNDVYLKSKKKQVGIKGITKHGNYRQPQKG